MKEKPDLRSNELAAIRGANSPSVVNVFATMADSMTHIAHATSHTDGTDDIQSATNTQKGLATDAHIIELERLGKVTTETLEPCGITNESEITLAGSTSTLNVTSTSNKVKYFYQGTYHELTTPASIAVTETIGFYFVYINASGVLALMASGSVPTPTWFVTVPLVAGCYWNGVELMISKECHGCIMDSYTHAYLHQTTGVRYQNDGGLAGTFNNTGLSITAGTIWDEDIRYYIAAKTQCRCYYRSGSTWLRTALQNEYYVSSAGHLQYDNAGTLTPCAGNDYMAIWVYASTDVDAPIIAILGQRKDTTIAAARANNTVESLVLGSLPTPEMKLLYRVIVRDDATPYEETQDYRTSSIIGAVASPSVTHASLAGLSNDDHPQYLLRTDYLSTDRVPIGTILPYADDSVPTGFLECNGAAVSRTTYSALYAIVGTTWGTGDGSTTFNIPETRGEFLRGWDHSRGIDNARAFASWQDYDVRIPVTYAQAKYSKSSGGTNSIASGSDAQNNNYTSGVETRPRNIAVMYIIKY